MPKHKLEKKSQFTQLDNQLIRNPELSSMEKVVLGIGLSVADGWKYNVNGLARYCKEGTDAVKAALRGLEEKGYLAHKAYGNSYQYYATVSREDFSTGTLKGVISKYFNNSFLNAVSSLVREENISVDELKELIRQVENGKDKA